MVGGHIARRRQVNVDYWSSWDRQILKIIYFMVYGIKNIHMKKT
jgi:hypothetical protein